MKIVNVMASSLDGRIGVHDKEGDSERLGVGMSNSEDQKRLRAHIESSDAIVVGASSIRANGSCLDHPGLHKKPPVWFIFAQKPLPESYEFWNQKHIRRVLVSSHPLPIVEGSGVESLTYGSAEPAMFLSLYLKMHNFTRALLFGGGIVNSWFYNQKLVDQLELTLTPMMIGKPNAPFLVAPTLGEAKQFLLLSSQASESFVFLSYSVAYE
ncbi:MAG: dihydrofolate reductase family protein [Chitinophagaceae bacterium]|nr:dihydrofolate reductase family protein [Oligoflexus sp.]